MRTPQTVIDEILDKEKGYVNHPSDRGGPTNHGITEAVARAHGYMGDMRDLPEDFARDIYQETYINDPRFHHIYALNPEIAMELIDTGVNMGPSVPSKWFQRTLNVMNKQGKLYPDLVVDGKIGPATVRAFAAFRRARGIEGLTVFLRALNCLQGARYIEIAEARQTQEDFVYGWILNRVEI